MPETPEQNARIQIDSLLGLAGWSVQDVKDANIHASLGVALREFPLNTSFGFADYLLYVEGRAAGVIEAKKAGATLTGVEVQSGRYAQGLPESLPAWRRPLPFLYESTGIETHFTNGLDPEPRSRPSLIQHMFTSQFATIAFPIPLLVEQQRIVAEADRRFSLVREVEAQVEANMKRAHGLRQAMLGREFSGETDSLIEA